MSWLQEGSSVFFIRRPFTRKRHWFQKYSRSPFSQVSVCFCPKDTLKWQACRKKIRKKTIQKMWNVTKICFRHCRNAKKVIYFRWRAFPSKKAKLHRRNAIHPVRWFWQWRMPVSWLRMKNCVPRSKEAASERVQPGQRFWRSFRQTNTLPWIKKRRFWHRHTWGRWSLMW